jgi:hypothetical protein
VPVPTAATPDAEDSQPAAGAGKALGTGKFQKGLVIDVLDLKRTNDNYLQVNFQIRNPTDEKVAYSINGFTFPNSMYYVEEGGKNKFLVTKDERGDFLAAKMSRNFTLAAGDKIEFWAKFGQPHKGIKHISFYFLDTEPIEDIPVPAAGK